MIERISGFPEMLNDPRVDFDWFKQLVIKAMKMRNNKEHMNLLFKVMDANCDGRIRDYDLCRVSGEVNEKPLTLK